MPALFPHNKAAWLSIFFRIGVKVLSGKEFLRMVNEDKRLEELSLGEIRELARQRMNPEAWEHIMGSAESGSTQRRNQAALRRILFRQRIFHDITNPDTTVELFGRRLSSPTVVAPVGSFSKIRKRAEHEVAEGASRAGSMVFVSHAAKSTIREWTEGITAPLVFMGYLSKGREKVLENAKGVQRSWDTSPWGLPWTFFNQPNWAIEYLCPRMANPEKDTPHRLKILSCLNERSRFL